MRETTVSKSPPAYFQGLPTDGVWRSFVMFYGGANNAPADLNQRRNLGYLYANNYHAAGKSYYCSSMNLRP